MALHSFRPLSFFLLLRLVSFFPHDFFFLECPGSGELPQDIRTSKHLFFVGKTPNYMNTTENILLEGARPTPGPMAGLTPLRFTLSFRIHVLHLLSRSEIYVWEIQT